ncbi:O-antigen ligase family protein [Metallumcola ferriviriculae]|uniref:O-antigen ligase family protein n=1 Tax=Metallumcola ferriviriculae TaxID=3039180 RepID=A0AAU0USC2_9FIRM|nr:O-antigen ligase family protein [Desulfitibacteraceae bacterium MK1]
MQRAATNIYLLVLMLVLGVTPLLKNGFYHWILYLDMMLVGLAVLYALGKGARPRWHKMTVIYFSGYIIIVFLTFFSGIDPHETLYVGLKLLLYLGVCYLASSTLIREEIYRLNLFLVVVTSLVASTGILYFLLLNSSRIESTFINSNPLGLFLVMGFFLALFPYLYNGKKGYLLALLLTGTGAMLTGSRGSMVAAFLPYLITLIQIVRLRIPGGVRRLMKVTALVVAVVILISIIAPCVQTSINETVGDAYPIAKGRKLLEHNLVRAGSFASSSVGGRLSFWLVALKEFQAHPFTGVGAGNYHNAYFYFWNDDRFYSRFTHNQYLQVLAETGMFGFFFFTLTMAMVIWVLWRQRRGDPLYWGFFLALLSFIIHMGIDFSWDMPAVTLTFWAVVGMAWSLTDPTTVASSRRFLALAMVAMLLIGGMQFGSDWLARQGSRFTEQQQYRQAIEKYSLAVKIYPWKDTYWSGLSFTYDRLYRSENIESNLNRATMFLDKALLVNPSNSYLMDVQAAYFEAKGQAKQAERLYRQAVEASGFYPQARVKLGNFYLDQKRYLLAKEVFAEGIYWFSTALRAAPDSGQRVKLQLASVDLYRGMAAVEEKLGNTESARHYSAKANEILTKIQFWADDGKT